MNEICLFLWSRLIWFLFDKKNHKQLSLCLETVLRKPLILSLRSLIFLIRQLPRFLYDRYQGVQPFQRSHRVSNQIFLYIFHDFMSNNFDRTSQSLSWNLYEYGFFNSLPILNKLVHLTWRDTLTLFIVFILTV